MTSVRATWVQSDDNHDCSDCSTVESNNVQSEWCVCIKQSVRHLFFECPIVEMFWDKLHEYITNTFYFLEGIELDFSFKHIFLNSVVTNNMSHLVNFVILVAKQYIYSRKCQNKRVRFDNFIKIIENQMSIERYNAV